MKTWFERLAIILACSIVFGGGTFAYLTYVKGGLSFTTSHNESSILAVRTKSVLSEMIKGNKTSYLRMDVQSGKFQVVQNIIEDPKDVMVIFGDFNCPFCKRDEAKARSFALSTGIESIYFIEAAILGQNSRDRALKSIATWKFSPESYERSAFFDRKSKQSHTPALEERVGEAGKILDSHLELVADARVTATPTYIIEGKAHVGALKF